MYNEETLVMFLFNKLFMLLLFHLNFNKLIKLSCAAVEIWKLSFFFTEVKAKAN